MATNNTVEMSKVALFFDTETTGLPKFRAPCSDSRQPRLVQLAYVLADVGGVDRASSSTLIQPDGWTVPARATEVNGLTTEDAKRYGVPLHTALHHFMHLLSKADVLVAHNIEFDEFLLRIAFEYLGNPEVTAWCNLRMDNIEKYCTATELTPVMKIPSAARGLAAGYPYRTPKLSFAYQHYTGKELEGAHDAMNDTRACQVLYEYLQGNR